MPFGIIYRGVKMIYITGDTHGFNDIDKLVFNKTLASLSKDDYLLITGDFAGIWDVGMHDEDILDFYAKRYYSISRFSDTIRLSLGCCMNWFQSYSRS